MILCMTHRGVFMEARIPECGTVDLDGMTKWFEAMAAKGLLFHPEDDPADIISVESGMPVFLTDEVRTVRETLARFFAFDYSMTIEACYPVFMRTAGFENVGAHSD